MKKWLIAALCFYVQLCYSKTASVNLFSLTSPDFQRNSLLSKVYGKEFGNKMPVLLWQHAPQATQSFALIVYDPNALNGHWVHLIIYNIPGHINKLDQRYRYTFGKNSWGNLKYDGPAPPPGKAHHYIFTLYALNRQKKLPDGLSEQELLKRIQNDIIAKTSLVGLYQQ